MTDIILALGLAAIGFGIGYAYGYRIGFSDNVAVKVEKILVEQFQIQVGDEDED